MACERSGRKSYEPVKLTGSEVLEVRARYEDGGVTYAKLCREYGVSTMTIWRAVHGVHRYDEPRRLLLTDAQVCEVWEQFNGKRATGPVLAEAYGVSLSSVYAIASGVMRAAATRHLRLGTQEEEG